MATLRPHSADLASISDGTEAALEHVRHFVLRGLTVAGLLMGLWWAFAFDVGQDPAWFREAVGATGSSRAVAFALMGAMAGALAGALVLVVRRRRARHAHL